MPELTKEEQLRNAFTTILTEMYKECAGLCNFNSGMGYVNSKVNVLMEEVKIRINLKEKINEK